MQHRWYRFLSVHLTGLLKFKISIKGTTVRACLCTSNRNKLQAENILIFIDSKQSLQLLYDEKLSDIFQYTMKNYYDAMLSGVQYPYQRGSFEILKCFF